ncbi:MAG TPA: endonuclease III, partial [Methylomirabilota bacterium]|nr:endonuclease III [Methylomirabilota bacterium]
MSIGQRIRTLRRLSPTWRATALAEVAAQWHDPFRVLIACILSLRTQDRTTGPAAARLFAVADTPAAMLALPARQIERLIYPVGFYRTKARVIRGLCRDL